MRRSSCSVVAFPIDRQVYAIMHSKISQIRSKVSQDIPQQAWEMSRKNKTGHEYVGSWLEDEDIISANEYFSIFTDLFDRTEMTISPKGSLIRPSGCKSTILHSPWLSNLSRMIFLRLSYTALANRVSGFWMVERAHAIRRL